MKVTTKIAPVKGIGKPDYSTDVSAAIERAGLYLKYNQQSRIFARNWTLGDVAYPLIPDTGLAAGAEDHLVDSDTLAALPITLPKGFSLSVIAVGFTSSQDIFFQVFLDSLIAHNFGINANGASVYQNKLWDLSTLWYDATAASAHTIDAKIYNRGEGILYGGVALWCVIEAVGTPPWPTTKDCVCPYCSHKQTVSVEVSTITCDGCSKVYLVTTFSSLKHTQRVIKC